MSRLDDLIALNCPHGVQFRTIESCVVKSSSIKWAEHVGKEFRYIDLASVDRVTHAIESTQDITSNNAPDRAQQIVIAGDVIFGTTRPMLRRYAVIPVEYDGHICSTGFCVLRPAPEILLANFLFHLLGTADFYRYVEANERGAGYPAISDSVVKKFRIPVPPLAIQREIVRVLDEMGHLHAALEIELGYRSRQYAYYRDSLLGFVDTEGIRWLPMGEIGEFIRGRRFTKGDVVPDGIGSIHYGEIYTRYGVYADKVLSRVRPELRPTLRFARTGDVVIAAVGETVEDVCKAVAWLGDEDVAIHDDCFAYRHTLNPKFVSYYFQTSTFHSEKNKYVARAKVKRISGESLAKLRIPVPTMEDQELIVGILDKFDTLVNSLSIGLPAEIKARRQQYEYYRDKLLSFEEVT
jgi:type I restriction enzyme, S subunit